jgi:hypothetical protein
VAHKFKLSGPDWIGEGGFFLISRTKVEGSKVVCSVNRKPRTCIVTIRADLKHADLKHKRLTSTYEYVRTSPFMSTLYIFVYVF